MALSLGRWPIKTGAINEHWILCVPGISKLSVSHVILSKHSWSRGCTRGVICAGIIFTALFRYYYTYSAYSIGLMLFNGALWSNDWLGKRLLPLSAVQENICSCFFNCHGVTWLSLDIILIGPGSQCLDVLIALLSTTLATYGVMG